MPPYKNVGFQKVHASKDNRFFVGLSNGGIPGAAFVIFDSEGNLIREQKHHFLPRGLHTLQSVTIERVWYDDEQPDVEFDVREGRLLAVFVRGSNKQKYNLLERDLGFRERPF